MKKLKDIIEGLKISSKSKVSDDKNILDKDINSIDELHDVIEQYFKMSNFNTTISKVDEVNQKWKYKIDHGIIVGAHFFVTFFNNSKNPIFRSHKLQFAEYKNNFVMQLLVYNKGKAQYCRIHGGSVYNEFHKGDNLLNFIETAIQHTKENHPIDKDPNLLEIFKEL